MSMKYLVTGGTGFLGKHLCRFFDSKNINYLSTVRKNPMKNQVATGDLSEYSDWPTLFNGIDVVVHTAAKAHDMSNSIDLELIYKKVNLELTSTLAQAAKANGVKKFIFVSTIKVNGEFTENKAFTADDVPAPQDNYGKYKMLAEKEVLSLHEPGVFEVVIVRPCLIYGSGVKANFEKLISLVKKQIPLPFGSIHNKRSFVSVDNLADFILCCANSPKASGQIFLVSDDNDLSLPELIGTISKCLDIKAVLIPVPQFFLTFCLSLIGKSDFSNRLFANLQVDVNKSKELLGWAPPYRTNDEIKKMLR